MKKNGLWGWIWVKGLLLTVDITFCRYDFVERTMERIFCHERLERIAGTIIFEGWGYGGGSRVLVHKKSCCS
jgi:hypothetical protein